MTSPMPSTTNRIATPVTLRAQVLPGVTAIPRDAWTALFPTDSEGWDYYAACEAAPPPAFTFAAIAVYAGDRIIAAAPVFRLTYRLDTPMQGRWRPLGEWLANAIPRIFKLPMIGLGSPLADRCHLGFAPDLTESRRRDALHALLAGLDAHAAAEKIEILAVKDLADRELEPVRSTFADAGFTLIPSLPVAVLDVPFTSEEAYMASLSAATRKDIRRKLKGAAGATVEIRENIDDIENEIVSLYDSTRGQSGVDYGDFEKLLPGYFTGVMRNLGERAVVMIYRLDGRIIGFNLLFVEADRIIDKFIGMHYPVAREHNLYVLSWMTNVRYCLARGIARMQTGQTAYSSKLRFGSRLEKSWILVRHRIGFWNWVFAKVGPRLAFDKMDPDLAARANNNPRA